MMRDEVYERKASTQKCWYKDFCDNFGTDKCTYTCKKFTQTDYMFQLSNLPKCMWKAITIDDSGLCNESKDMLNMICGDIEFFVKRGFNLYLYGEVGVGKTSWAVKLMNNYFASVAEKNDFRTRGLYVNVPSFLRDFKFYLTYKSENWFEFLKEIQTCDIVIWDDLYQTEATKYESQIVYSYINERIFAKKCNIFTSNLSPEQLDQIDQRLYSRVCCGSDCLCVDGLDMRFKNTYSYFINSSEVVEENGTDSNN